MKASIGLFGLAVMGENLALNLEHNGFTVAICNRTMTKVDIFMAGKGKGKNFIATHSLPEFVNSLEKPRKIFLMVKAGKPIDQMIDLLLPLLAPGDIIIDGGNSNYLDTDRRVHEVEKKGMYYVGTGVSGGEEGALHGPALMPGGSFQAWPAVKPFLQAIAAKVEGVPCCTWIGEGGSGHFVKMVHNGIEYGDMELICETYDIMRKILHLDNNQIQLVFREWDKGVLSSYLIKITADILEFKDEDGLPLVEKILDVAGQKGTGKWTVIEALQQGVPLDLIASAVFMRYLSDLREEREQANKIFPYDEMPCKENTEDSIKDLKDALYVARIISYAQGFDLIQKAKEKYNWSLQPESIALIWRGGCIIRSVFLGKIAQAFEKNDKLTNLIFDPFFQQAIEQKQKGLRHIVAQAAMSGIPLPAFSAALSWFDSYRCVTLPINLLQAQRDYFGAHTYERTDRQRGQFFHTNWTGHGGTTTSSTYNA